METFILQAEKGEIIEKSNKSKSSKSTSKKPSTPSKYNQLNAKKSAQKVERSTPSLSVEKSNGKQSVLQRPHLLPLTLDNNNNNDMCSSDEDDQTECVAADSRITYAIAMNNRTAHDGSSNSGRNIGCGSGSRCSGSSCANLNEPAAGTTVEEAAPTERVERYPRRARRQVNYNELDTPEDDHYICKYLIILLTFQEYHTFLGVLIWLTGCDWLLVMFLASYPAVLYHVSCGFQIARKGLLSTCYSDYFSFSA